MPKMFGFFSAADEAGEVRFQFLLSRLKGHLHDHFHGSRSPSRSTKRHSHPNGEDPVTASVSGRVDDLAWRCSSDTFDLNGSAFESSENWAVLSTEGDKPIARFDHAAAMVGSKMIVFGGDSGTRLLDDTKILSLDKLTWDSVAAKIRPPPTGRSPKLRPCKGHCLVPWGKNVILVGGKSDPPSDKISVWTFNTETELWSHMEAKGDIPVSRSGHTVIRAGPALILFGGEDAKGKKLHDLHMFDLKSLTWLPLNYKGSGPSPRSNHVAALYDDRILLVFGGQSKSKTLNDIHALDFETAVPSAESSRTVRGLGKGFSGRPYPRLCNAGRPRLEPGTCWLQAGFSMVPLYYKDKIVLVAFGGNRKEPSDKVEVLVVLQNEHCFSWRSAPDAEPLLYDDSPPSSRELADHLNNCAPLYSTSSAARSSLATTVDNSSGRKSLPDSLLHNSNLGSSSLPKDELEKRLAERDREVEALKEKVTGLELAQEESNNLSNTVHADNVRLEREVAFLKAVMDETQKARRASCAPPFTATLSCSTTDDLV
ncbi:hypothetical protein PR202_ga22655 [Eleusine coracana subsp. coracana]|uniref:Galactose oxidase/kelch repeat superfamily protein n=1 Tax=Eleusine coracana subsp. coracana TaxID=191504 RepID=A0AAV5D3S0_ELECO|nr:hypothetical protein PR202_ga22655 [Eleusine coracana subsp. coracana]